MWRATAAVRRLPECKRRETSTANREGFREEESWPIKEALGPQREYTPPFVSWRSISLFAIALISEVYHKRKRDETTKVNLQ